MSEFSTLIAEAQQFYAALSQNNSRDWWLDNKATYDSKIRPQALALIDELSRPLADLADAPVKGKLFRPHRDVRFSKDKTPYNTHLHMAWTIQTEARQNPVFFFGIGLDYVTTGLGLWEFDKTVLDDWRKFADLDAKRLLKIVGDVEAQGFAIGEPALKRVPRGFDPDHIAGHLLRMKGLVARRDIGADASLPDAVIDSFTAGWPINALLIQVGES